MKKVFIFVIASLIIVVIIAFLIQKNKQNKKITNISNIENLRFSYTSGYMMNSDTRYELDCKEGCFLLYKPYGISSSEEKRYKVDNEIVLEIEKVLNKYNVSKWDGFDGNDQNVLDGDSFGFFVTMKNGDTIEASGYMSWPKNYGEVKSELEYTFGKVINNNDK